MEDIEDDQVAAPEASSRSKRPPLPPKSDVKPPPAARVDEKADKAASDPMLLAAFGLFVLTSLGNRLFQKLMTIPMYNYPITVNLLSVAAYVPLSFAYILPATYCVADSPITAEQLAIPKSRFAVMGAFDCVSSLMQVLAVNYIPNASTLVLLQQSAIPISMVVSRLSFQHVRYDWWQICGAGVVLCGIGVVLSPQLALSSGARDDDYYADAPGPRWLWPLVIILSCVPMCLGSVYKEQALGENDVDVVYLNGWVAVFQTIMSIPLAVPTAFATHLPLVDLPANIGAGFRCYLGHSSQRPRPETPFIALDAARRISGPVDFEPVRADDCGTAPYFVTAYIAFNLAYNILIVVILKRGSTSLLYLGSTVLVPVSNVMFSLDFVPGHKPLHVADVAGLVVIMCGLVLYRCGAALAKSLNLQTCLRLAAELLVLDDLDDDEDDDENEAPLADSPPGRIRDYLRRPPAERRSLLAAARAPRRGEDDVPSPLLRESLKATRQVRTATRHRVAKFFGLNHLEMLQPLCQAQTLQARRRIIRSNAQIRKDFLLRLGFSPDPLSVPRSPNFPPRQTAAPGDLRRHQALRFATHLPAAAPVADGDRASSGLPRRANSFDARRLGRGSS